MASPVPRGVPRPGNYPPNFNPNVQRTSDSLSENMQNLQINSPPVATNPPGPRPPPFGQPPFPSAARVAPPSSAFIGGSPISRPGPPPAGLPRASPPLSVPPQAAFASSAPTGRPLGAPSTQPPPFSSRPPPPSAFPSMPVASSPVMPSSNAPRPISNGPPMFASGALPGAPRFPSVGSTQQPPFGPPPAMMSTRVPPPPSMHPFPGGPATSAPQGFPSQPGPVFSATSQGIPPPTSSSFGSHMWQSQPRQVAPPIPGTMQPPRMFGMPPPPPTQSVTAVPPAMGHLPVAGAPVAGPSKIDPNQIPRPMPSSSVIVYETRQGNQANPPPPATCDYVVKDTGNCSPRYMRCTINQIPCTGDLSDLRELNNSLEALAAIFPDIQIEVFRELLSNFDGESRLALVADTLLKNRATWVKGRWRVDKESTIAVPEAEVFRSKEYKKAVQSLAWREFKGLSRSTIHAVLAESNYSYLEARQTLVTLSSKSWRFTISSLFFRRKPIATGEAENHPLVTWRSTGQGSIIPTVRSTGSPELDRELYHTLVMPLKERDREEREAKDRGLAFLLNNEEAEAAESTHECVCCFTSGAFEGFTHCNRDGHMICFRCVQYSIKEAIFGQGWQSSINAETGTLKCLAVEGDGCPGHIPADHIQRAMEEEKMGAEILHKLDRRLAEHSLLASRLPLVRCPFCDYAEIDELYTPAEEASLRINLTSLYHLFFLILCIGMIPFVFPVVFISSIVCLILSTRQTFANYMSAEWSKALTRHRRRRRGLKFTCQNTECKRVSCLSCDKSWQDIHVCNESSLVALRTQVEQAMSMAIKRVCPRCNTSFVKNAGCNKLTCPCGYKMCYVCRADLSETGYRHFCDHFRPDGDPTPCKECERCNLWESEDAEKVLQAAREEAERKWKAMENRELSGTERAFLETGVAGQRSEASVERVLMKGKVPALSEVFDLIVETIFI